MAAYSAGQLVAAWWICGKHCGVRGAHPVSGSVLALSARWLGVALEWAAEQEVLPRLPHNLHRPHSRFRRGHTRRTLQPHLSTLLRRRFLCLRWAGRRPATCHNHRRHR